MLNKICALAKDPGKLFLTLDYHGFFRWMSDKRNIMIKYKIRTGRKLNLDNPTRFNEKLQWLKLYDRNPIYRQLVDKYSVREYISQELGEEFLVPLLGVWDNAKQIDFDKLPDQFVLKCNHDSGSVIICRDKDFFDSKKAVKSLNKKLKKTGFWYGREWPYKNLKPRIIAEQYMECDNGEELIDYKFFCFSGEPKFVYVSQGLSDHSTAHLSYVWLNWEQAPFCRTDFPQFDKLPEKPKTFEKMIEYSKLLAKNYPFARVDFYEINGQMYFGEITFYPGSGFTVFDPEEWDEKLGEWIDLSQIKNM